MNQSNFQTVVVGVDFSPYSRIVVKQALELAKKHKAQLIFVHALSSTALMTGDIKVDIKNDFIKPLTEEIVLFYKLKELAPTAKVVVSLGRPCDIIISMAKKFQTPLIIVGHKGTSTLMGRFFIGSTAEQLALHSPFPVWIHRGNAVKLPKKILLPCDYSKRTTNSLEVVKSFDDSSKSKYEFFHVFQQPFPFLDADEWHRSMEAIREKENSNQKKFHKRYPEVPFKCKLGHPAHLIAEESKKFDLIAMAPHNREGIFSGFGSVTAKVVRSGNTPVLITH